MQGRRINEESADNRLSERDRRTDDIKPLPRREERRQSVERRLPIVDESVASFSDWVKSMVIFLAKGKKRAKVKSKVKSSAKVAKPKK